MTIKAKPILENKFWIVENNGQRMGTLSFDDERYMFSSKVETCFFDNKRQMKNRFGVDIVWGDETKVVETPKDLNSLSVNNYPTTVFPYNSMYDVKRKLPLFTKSEKSKSVYCAGYYIIKFDKGWVKSSCPKLITVERYETRGPFKTELEMRQELSIANR
jgi:hypothetical protein|tara:strand:- start:2675 stop:3154 length:480 start_codon:yes stop_codon:yes gene_type:complete